ncbi:MAG: 5-methyltetrahydropteroyltriglutamate--homocysteine S-methyltransferase [Burkholderiaceae bacterium]
MTAIVQTPPFRADHVGSLLRPAALRDAFRRIGKGEISPDEFRRIQDDAIRHIVSLQEEVGLQVVNDGEFRRGSYWSRFCECCGGMKIRSASFRFRDDEGNETEFTAPYAAGKIFRERPITVDEVQFIRPLTERTLKVTMPSPSTMHFYRLSDWADQSVYADAETFFADLGKVFQQEIAELAAAGVRYVQIDEVPLAMLCDPKVRERVQSFGVDPAGLVDIYVNALNEAVKTKPADMYVGVHTCRGNYKGRYLSQGGYDDVAEKLFGGANVSHFLLEYDTPRAGDFAPLRFLPKNKGVVLGLVSSKVPALESMDTLARRVDQAAQYVDRSRMAISPQCGFASTVGGNDLTEDEMRAKLELVVAAGAKLFG